MKKLSIVIFILWIVQTNAVFGCFIIQDSITKFDETEYVFIGDVVGYTKPIAFENKTDQSVNPASLTIMDPKLKGPNLAVGLVVKLKESVYLPKLPKGNFEVFRISTWADCSYMGDDLERLTREFPVGSEVRVIAKEAKFIQAAKDSDIIRLEHRPNETGGIAINNSTDGVRMSTATSLFDYKSYKFDINIAVSEYLLPSFEIRKDLLRLKLAFDQRGKNAILDRLSDLSGDNDSGLELRDVFRENTASETDFKRYYHSYLKKIAYEETLSELVRRGYKPDSAKAALAKAREELEEKAEMTYSQLLTRCLRILAKEK